jgi:hypothetical protein
VILPGVTPYPGAGAYLWGVVPFLLFVSVRVPWRLSCPEREDRDRAVRRFVRAGLAACVLGHLAMVGEGRSA